MFKVGDKVIYTKAGPEYEDKYICVVTSIDGDDVIASFIATEKWNGAYLPGYNFGTHRFHKCYFKPVGPPLTKEERVLKKIKWLDEQWAKKQKEKKESIQALKSLQEKYQNGIQSIPVQNGQRLRNPRITITRGQAYSTEWFTNETYRLVRGN